MHIQYLAHSGFFIECADCIYIFDYYQGALPQLSADKPVAVFASHSHRDHYNPEIFTLLKNNGAKNITAVLAKDIKSHHYPPNIPVIKAYAHQSYRVGSAQIDTLLSTDSGVAFVLHTNEGTVYHAGDLNDWQGPGKRRAVQQANDRQLPPRDQSIKKRPYRLRLFARLIRI